MDEDRQRRSLRGDGRGDGCVEWNVCFRHSPPINYVVLDCDKGAIRVQALPAPRPRHIREDFADGSVVIKSVDKDEQGRPLRCAMISRQIYGRAWVEKGDSRGIGQAASEAISEAIRYVETGE